jgi:glutamate synthase (NADPH) large chain
VVQGQQADRRHPGRAAGVSLPSPPTHQTKYSIEEAVAKMIQSMSMAWGFRVPVYPKISGTSTAWRCSTT